MADKFQTQIDKFVVNTEEKMIAVIKTSIQSVVQEAQTSREKEGGKMPVITGFLRSSGISQLGSMPVGPGRGDRKGKYNWTTNQLGVILASFNIGDVFYFGWTAKYARAREAHHAFLDSAVQNWQSHVDEAAGRLKK